MAYATWDNVIVWLPPDSQESSDLFNQAADLLEPEYRRINSRLGERYVVPFVLATSPTAYAWARDLNAKFVAAKAMIAVRALQGEEGEATWYPQRLLDEAEADLTAATLGALFLSDAVLATEEGTQFRATDGYDGLSSTAQDALAPWFTRADKW